MLRDERMNATAVMPYEKPRRHDHRQSLWVLGAGNASWLWCYRCGAIRPNRPGREYTWSKPTGLDGKNPAL